MPSVLAETPRITEAVLASEPQSLILDALSDRFEDSIAHAVFNVRGGALYDAVTASFIHMQLSPEDPFTGRPVVLAEPPQSYIGKLLVNLINQSHQPRPDSNDFVPSYWVRSVHVCTKSEPSFLEALRDKPEETGRVPVITEYSGKPAFYNKPHGSISALTIAKQGVPVENITLPPGIIGFTDETYDRDEGTWGDLTFAPCRVSAFAIPKAERVQTFQHTFDGQPYTEHTADVLAGLPSITNVTQQLIALATSRTATKV